MSTETSPQTVRLSGSASLLAHVAYSLGFTPTDSLAAVSLRGANSQVGLVARVDLTDAAEAAPTLAGHMNTDRAERVVLVVYTDDQEAGRRAAGAVRMALTSRQWHQVWQQTTTGYRPLYTDEALRPITDITDCAEAVRRIVGGDALEATAADLLPRRAAGAARTRAARAAARWAAQAHTPAEDLALWRGATRATAPLSAARYGRLSATLGRVSVRDALIVAMLPASPADLPAQVADQSADPGAVAAAMDALIGTGTSAQPARAAHAHEAVLAQVLAHTQGTGQDAPAWTLWALVQWWRGDGVRARAALTLALDTDPDYRLAHLLTGALNAGIAPGWLRR